MLSCAVAASPTATPMSSSCCFHTPKLSFTSTFSAGIVSLPRNPFPSISTLYPIKKDVGRNFQALESHFSRRISVNAVASEVTSDNDVDAPPQNSNDTDALASSVKNLSISRRYRKEKNPKRLSSSAPKIKKPNHFPVIKYPLGTEKAIKAMSESNTLVFVVDKHADKTNIKEAVNLMFNVRTKKVNTSIMPGGIKKAFIMLAPEFKASDVAKKIGIF